MTDDFSLTVEQVAKLLTVSTRTVRRFVQRGQLTKHYQVVGKARELRFSEEEVSALRKDMTKGRQTTTGQDIDSDRTPGQAFSGSIDIKDFLQRYEAAVGQLGYFRAKAEEVQLLTARADSLAKANQNLEGESAGIKKSIKEKEQENEGLKSEISLLTKRSNFLNVIVAIMALAIIVTGIVILGPTLLANITNR